MPVKKPKGTQPRIFFGDSPNVERWVWIICCFAESWKKARSQMLSPHIASGMIQLLFLKRTTLCSVLPTFHREREREKIFSSQLNVFSSWYSLVSEAHRKRMHGSNILRIHQGTCTPNDKTWKGGWPLSECHFNSDNLNSGFKGKTPGCLYSRERTSARMRACLTWREGRGHKSRISVGAGIAFPSTPPRGAQVSDPRACQSRASGRASLCCDWQSSVA